jgi:hypothetical protein
MEENYHLFLSDPSIRLERNKKDKELIYHRMLQNGLWNIKMIIGPTRFRQ